MDGVYSNDAIYANLGGDPLYANIAEVSKFVGEFFTSLSSYHSNDLHFLQANEAQAVLEVPDRAGLAGRTADAVAWGLGRAQTSARQPLSGLRPLGLTLEVSFSSFFYESVSFL